MALETLQKLAPFMRRARVVVNGRERLAHLGGRLAFIVVTTDISENSRSQALHDFPGPVYQCLTSEDVERLFGLKNTKELGVMRSALAEAVREDLTPYLLKREELLKPRRKDPGE